jgi:hypothetical protein
MVSELETKEYLLGLGFNIGSRVFTTANKRVAEGKAGKFDKPTGRPKKVTLNQLLLIKDLLKKPENSFPAAQKTISHRIFDSTSSDFLTPTKVTQPCYYLEHTISILYLDYLDVGGSFKETTFRKALKKYFPYYKKACKESDLCHYCECGKKLQENLKALVNKHCLHTHTVDNCNCEFENTVNAEKIAILAALEIVKKHRNNKDIQRKAFLKQRQSLQAGEFLLVMDFKANLQLMESQRQVGRDFYNKPQRTCFGANIYFLGPEGNIVKHPYDIFSKCLNHDAHFVGSALNLIFSDQWFKDQSFKSGIFWMDGGPHFKNLELSNYFQGLKENKFSAIEWNFFVENHGKNPCDSRFSSISTWLTSWFLKSQKEIRTTTDIIEAVQAGQMCSNECRGPKKNKPMIFSTQLILKITPSINVHKLKLPGITSFYHFACVTTVSLSFFCPVAFLLFILLSFFSLFYYLSSCCLLVLFLSIIF